MRILFSIVFCAVGAGPALGEAPEAADPLAPCFAVKSPLEDVQTPDPGWGVKLASSFKRQHALDMFVAVQTKYSDLLRDYDPSVFELRSELGQGPTLFGAHRLRWPQCRR
jgi:hypothetical protein